MTVITRSKTTNTLWEFVWSSRLSTQTFRTKNGKAKWRGVERRRQVILLKFYHIFCHDNGNFQLWKYVSTNNQTLHIRVVVYKFLRCQIIPPSLMAPTNSTPKYCKNIRWNINYRISEIDVMYSWMDKDGYVCVNE